MQATEQTIPGFHCGVCFVPLTDEDCARNYSNHPHDGYWCVKCLSAYSMTRDAALQHLRTRLHSTSQFSVNSH